jgi:isopentenyl phosphate kinase
MMLTCSMFINASNHVGSHQYEREFVASIMAERIVMKLGGGLITEKGEFRSPRLDIIQQCAKEIQQIVLDGYEVILVHGAGSFGHLMAKEFRIAEGKISNFSHDFSDCSSQEEAVVQIRKDMLELNQYIVSALDEFNVVCHTFPTHVWARNTGPQFHGDLSQFSSLQSNHVSICYGDVVDCDGDAEFGILSGDDIVYRLASEIPDVRRVVFGLGGVDGVLEQPPEQGKEQLLIPLMNPDRDFSSQHQHEIDVTGGIGLKVSRSFELAKVGIEVIFVNGEVPGRLTDASKNDPVIGTKFALFAQ